ncbi:hypothetical protein [Hydrogenimonas cancrithermarum]|uniref:Uncharacterized protein n=1 Tax=Hydrogenimonas cancrithermarum TaxID=2993563 RepID=A0ABN6WXG0_9BACT|nr:hypothetical protein [Hydrogenimonas cancrithermarum]BDY13990.1 hypothetical protein HCR_23030 [Hydrogenimonas cancrithermarum]
MREGIGEKSVYPISMLYLEGSVDGLAKIESKGGEIFAQESADFAILVNLNKLDILTLYNTAFTLNKTVLLKNGIVQYLNIKTGNILEGCEINTLLLRKKLND